MSHKDIIWDMFSGYLTGIKEDMKDIISCHIPTYPKISSGANCQMLLSGAEEDPDGNRNVKAVAVEEERSAKKTREKQKATPKKTVKSKEVIPDTESDGEKPVSRIRKRDSEGKGTNRARASAGKGKGKKEVVELDESGDDGQPAPNSRHLSVSVSQIYNDWNGPMLDATRRKFQSMIFARDGATLKSQAPANA